MMEELKKLIAFIFQRSGKEKLYEKDIYMTLSFELGWMTPKQGRKAIEKALELGLVKKKGEEILPNFDYKAIEIPLGFKLDGEKIEEMEMDLLSRTVSRIVSNTKLGEKKVRDEIRKLAEELDVYPEIAALLIAYKNNVKIDDLIKEAKEMVKNS